MQIKTLKTNRDIEDLLDLQAVNLPHQLDPQALKEQGFVTVRHTQELLRTMMAAAPQVILRDRAAMAGYALAMPRSMRDDIPVLIPMFETIDELTYDERPLSEHSYIVMGQVCVAKPYRGQGNFDLLYDGLRMHLSDTYDLLITQVSSRNPRSLRAHARVGFQTIHEYTAPDGEHWFLIGWDWS